METINKRSSELENRLSRGGWCLAAKGQVQLGVKDVCTHRSKDFKEGCGDSKVDTQRPVATAVLPICN